LLVSSDFLASNYCYEKEMKRAVERHELGEARVVPVILRQCDWQGAPFSKLQGLPKDMKPVTSWVSHDEAFTDVAVGIRKVAEELSRSPRKLPKVSDLVRQPSSERLRPATASRKPQVTGGGPVKWRPTPGKLVLQGPVIEILIGTTWPQKEEERAVGLESRRLRVQALIDTGASLTVINPQIATTCKLLQTDWSRIVTVGGGGGVYPVYAAAISFPGTGLPRFDVVRVVACPIIGPSFFSCLIGRDILRNWLLTYDGLNGQIEIQSR
jgi:predicted aspartyl protease